MHQDPVDCTIFDMDAYPTTRSHLTSRDTMIMLFEARLSREQLFTLHNGLMIDYDHLPDPAIYVLAIGPRWMTFEVTSDLLAAEPGPDADCMFGYIDIGVVENCGTCDKEFGTTDFEWASEFATLLGLEQDLDVGNGVYAWKLPK